MIITIMYTERQSFLPTLSDCKLAAACILETCCNLQYDFENGKCNQIKLEFFSLSPYPNYPFSS